MSILSRFPLMSNAALSSALLVSGDFAARQLRERKRSLPGAGLSSPVGDLRSLRLALAGGLQGLLLVPWLHVLQRLIPQKTMLALAAKVCLQSVVFGSAATTIAVAVPDLLSGKSLMVVSDRVTEQVPGLVLSGFVYWPLVHVLCFRLVPLRFQPAFQGAAGFCWAVYLSAQLAGSSAMEVSVSQPA